MALSFDLFSPLAANIGAAEERIAARIGAPDMSTEDLLLLQRDVAIWSLFTSEVSTSLPSSARRCRTCSRTSAAKVPVKGKFAFLVMPGLDPGTHLGARRGLAGGLPGQGRQ
jgi:hypothetical protein